MTAYIDYVDNTMMLAHFKMLEAIRDACQTEGWTILRYDSNLHELIMMAPGLSSREQIFCGIYCYQDHDADYYNLAVATMKGYVAANAFLTQPGISPVLGVPAHNLRIDYWLAVNGQRLNVAMKVGTPVYESFGIGKFFPYASPGQYPQPLFAAGMLSTVSATRYSEITHTMPWKGQRNNLRMHFNDGSWKTPQATPWCSPTDASWVLPILAHNCRPTEDTYALYPVILYDAKNIYGVLDGIYHITGFNNVSENTLVIDGKNYVVLQDVSRTSFGDYFALELS
ncbi:hypothetical protein FHW67_000916 [Herbaspirillum sp. Sphag1AN]|uniref:hypothetical protein n=1 Tax=unclassified Herbaspirillum TaxID=2624150 RepID=UPI001615268D|nr:MULTISPECIES: hypothetical protein [unclassified Herbaspirillum]MBB3211668.1 hypothetical protein [Herbaspirillum sp. Sphag1AN]MBB3245064.1 hypothetical protein [Herbaspirillum sp. Sphag64]